MNCQINFTKLFMFTYWCRMSVFGWVIFYPFNVSHWRVLEISTNFISKNFKIFSYYRLSMTITITGTCYEYRSTVTECRIRIDAFQCDDRRNACIVELEQKRQLDDVCYSLFLEWLFSFFARFKQSKCLNHSVLLSGYYW